VLFFARDLRPPTLRSGGAHGRKKKSQTQFFFSSRPMLTKAQKKNAARTRRRERRAPEREQQVIQKQREKWALAVIQWYCQLWTFLKATAWMNPHKKAKLVALVRKGWDGEFDNWCKADGYVWFRISGNLRRTTEPTRSYYLSSSGVEYEFYDQNMGHFVLTTSGSFYKLGKRAMIDDKEILLESDKKSDIVMFHFLNGRPPFHDRFLGRC